MNVRPMYVGVGTCSCTRVDVRLYQIPGSARPTLACDRCLVGAGYEVPRSRTADDIETVDGEVRWKKP